MWSQRGFDFSGGRYMGQDGITRGYKVIKGGRGTRIPLFETVDQN